MVRNYRVFTRPGCWQDGVNQNEPLFAKNECQYVEIWWMKSQKSWAIVYSIRDVSDDISTFRTSIKIRLCRGWAQGSWLSNAAKTIAIRLITSEITVILAEKISPRHFIRKKAVLKAVQGARAMFSLSSVTTNTESGWKARKRWVFKSGDAAMYTLMCQVHLLCEHTRDHLSSVKCLDYNQFGN